MKLSITYNNVNEIIKSKYLEVSHETNKIIIEDVLLIVNNNKKYPPRGDTEEFRLPEDISTQIAVIYFNVNAYS